MDIFKVKRRCNKSNPKHIKQPTTGQERTQGIAPFLFVCTSEREKATPAMRAKQERGQAKDNRSKENKGKAKSIKGEQTQGQKKKNERQTRNKPYNRLTIHAHKSPTIHAKHANNTNPHNRHKTPSERP